MIFSSYTFFLRYWHHCHGISGPFSCCWKLIPADGFAFWPRSLVYSPRHWVIVPSWYPSLSLWLLLVLTVTTPKLGDICFPPLNVLCLNVLCYLLEKGYSMLSKPERTLRPQPPPAWVIWSPCHHHQLEMQAGSSPNYLPLYSVSCSNSLIPWRRCTLSIPNHYIWTTHRVLLPFRLIITAAACNPSTFPFFCPWSIRTDWTTHIYPTHPRLAEMFTFLKYLTFWSILNAGENLTSSCNHFRISWAIELCNWTGWFHVVTAAETLMFLDAPDYYPHLRTDHRLPSHQSKPTALVPSITFLSCCIYDPFIANLCGCLQRLQQGTWHLVDTHVQVSFAT